MRKNKHVSDWMLFLEGYFVPGYTGAPGAGFGDGLGGRGALRKDGKCFRGEWRLRMSSGAVRAPGEGFWEAAGRRGSPGERAVTGRRLVE